MPSNVEVRHATMDDVHALLPMIYALAILNNDRATITATQLREDGFGERPWFSTLIAESGAGTIGYAIWYLTYNASLGTRVLHIHHLYVEPSYRRAGVGRRLVVALASAALDAGCAGLVLGVAAENRGAIGFYDALGFHREHPPNPRYFIDREKMEDLATERSTR
jgi:ribosomal protein S18 acetylase RimI-like enzyme